MFGLLGPNGAGKSTTVRILTTLSRAGRRHARASPGIDVLASRVKVRRAIGVVGQKHGCDVEATGRENLVLQAELYGIAGASCAGAPASSSSASGSPTPPTARSRPTPAACSGAWTSRSG